MGAIRLTFPKNKNYGGSQGSLSWVGGSKPPTACLQPIPAIGDSKGLNPAGMNPAKFTIYKPKRAVNGEGNMFVVTLDLEAKPTKRRECQQTLQLIVERCLQSDGCRRAGYTIDPGEESMFHLTLEWNDMEDWGNYTQTDDFKALMGMKNLLTVESHHRLRKAGN